MNFDYDRVKSLNLKLNYIPHLNITKYLPEVPLRSLIKDLFIFDDSDFYPYITSLDNEKIAEHMANNWKGMCIIDSCKSGKHNIDYLCGDTNFEKLEFVFDEEGNPLYQPTDVGQLVPNIIDYLYLIADAPGKTRISRMVPNGGNPTWHSHRLLANKGDDKFTSKELLKYVLHVPLISNYRSIMGVAPKMPVDNPNVRKYWQKYTPGEVWIFNSYWYHNAFNMGENHRDHVMVYVNVDDKKLMPVLEKAVSEYTGPLIEEIELK